MLSVLSGFKTRFYCFRVCFFDVFQCFLYSKVFPLLAYTITYNQLTYKTDSNLFFISDQDDVWHKDKLLVQAAQFPQGGAEDLPLLVHSDLAVVDETLNPIHASLIAYMNLVPEPDAPLTYLLARNVVTGCATACNRRLLE